MFYAEKFSANYKFSAVVNPYQRLFPCLAMAYAHAHAEELTCSFISPVPSVFQLNLLSKHDG